jgi:hypothetical protein
MVDHAVVVLQGKNHRADFDSLDLDASHALYAVSHWLKAPWDEVFSLVSASRSLNWIRVLPWPTTFDFSFGLPVVDRMSSLSFLVSGI